MFISLTEYSKIHNKNSATIRRLAESGALKTAKKIGRNWVVEDFEDYPIFNSEENRKGRYSQLAYEKSTGSIFTPHDLATFVAEQMVLNFNKKSETIKILDPAIGDGILVNKLIECLTAKYSNLKISIKGFEINSSIIAETKRRLLLKYPNVSIEIMAEDFLNAEISEQYDLIIANPPYIRTQILGASKSQEIVKQLKLTGRIDIYYAFILLCRQYLKENGIAGFITSNKFLTIKSGTSVRKYLEENSNVISVIDFGDTKLFGAAVLPCVTVFQNVNSTNQNEFVSVYETKKAITAGCFNTIFEAIAKKQSMVCSIKARRFEIVNGYLSTDGKGTPWTVGTQTNSKWLEKVNRNTEKRFADIGKIRVGIKTTADNVFIKEHWDNEAEPPELLFPLITHRNAGQIIPSKNAQWQVLYTHTIINGKKQAVNINDYPKSLKYLEKHREQLSSRKYVQKANRNWFEIWVPQNPDSWKDKKIIFRDISEQPQFWYDESGSIVNGDCYWIDINATTSKDEVYMALAVANSSFIERYYDTNFNNKLYSGKRRFMSQYVEQFPLPNIDNSTAREAVELVKQVLENTLSTQEKSKIMTKIDGLVNKLFTL